MSDADSLVRASASGFEFLGEVTFETGLIFNDAEVGDTEIGGLSGLAYDAAGDFYYALSDDRGSVNDPRFYTLNIDLSDGSLDEGDVEFTDVVTLLDETGAPFGLNETDFEGIALTAEGTLFLASERDLAGAPQIFEAAVDGTQLGELPVPARFIPDAIEDGDRTVGVRDNLAFESLTLSPDGRFLFAATENALVQDGPAATLETGSLSRILQYDLETGEVVGEFVYEVEPIPDVPMPEDAFATNGLVELLAIDNDGTFLALERAFSVGVGNAVKLFQVNAQGALDVNGVTDLFREDELEDDGEILPPGPFEIDPAVIKTEILDIEADLGIEPDNLEALAFGPTLPDGSQSLIIVSDNNFNPDGQVTQVLALALDIETDPVVQPVLETPITLDVDPEDLEAGLDILLVNDDGFEAEGIDVLLDALVEAGHNVTLVAPQEEQSGQGTRISVEAIGQPTTVEEFAPGQFFVDATPITTVSAALDFILAEAEPDLVISGINEGANVGESIAISSGTVSAATEATRRNLPGIAVSAATSDDPAEQTAIFELSAEVTVDLVEQLVTARGEDAPLLPEGVGLSVNIPAGIEAISGEAITQLDEASPFDIFVGDLGAATGGEANGVPSLLASVAPPITPEEITVPESEGQNFLANFITTTPVDGDFTASNLTRETLEDRVEAAPIDAVATPLNILVTNDDGFDAEGIAVLSEVLAAAGHNITVVAPLEQQSGTGTALDVDLFFQPLEIAEQDISEEFEAFSVAAGVRTTTFAGLDFVLDGEAPDLVISGINEGENIGPGGAVSSGTVSAAVTALLRDVPAIAVSGGLDLTTFSTPTETYEIGAEFIVDLIAQLQTTQGDDASILPEGTGLSVNIPTRFPEGVEEIQGVAFTNASDTTPFEIAFGLLDPENPDAGAGLNFAPVAPPADPDPLSEGDQFLNGFITVTPIDGDFTADAIGQEEAAALLDAPTPELFGDSDDPAIWVNPNDPSQSVVYGTLKDGGLASFDLQGNVLETILPAPFGEIRYNNADIVYNFASPSQVVGGDDVLTDLVVASDRENDTLAIFAINPLDGSLTDVTSPDIPETIFGLDDAATTAYGLATYTSIVDGKVYAFVTQRDGAQIAQLELTPQIGPADELFVNAEVIRTLDLPVPTGDPEDSQSEGIVIDRETGIGYVALEEEVGILSFSAEPNGGDELTLVQSIDSGSLVPDIEGLTLYYGPDGSGSLIASSQGDSSFSVFDRQDPTEFLGSFSVGSNGDIDQVNESDGLDIINTPLGPDFPAGLLVVQDGANDPQNVVEDDEELENNSTNFTFVSVEDVASAVDVPLVLDPSSFDPRAPQPQSLNGGVSSNDIDSDSATLSALSTVPGEVVFEVSLDPDFAGDIVTLTETITDLGTPVTATVDGLEPDTEHFFRVTDAAGDIETGQFVTAAAAPVIDAGIVMGSSDADILLGGIDTDAVGDTILAGAGDDEIVLALAGEAAGGNTVLAGSGDDTIFASNDDAILGGAGNDTFIVEGTGNTLLGGAGDDTFILTGSDNLAAGGAGADVFVIAAPGDFPEVANAIADFDAAEDVLAGVSFEEVAFAGSDVLIDGNPVATLIGVDAASLTAASFV